MTRPLVFVFVSASLSALVYVGCAADSATCDRDLDCPSGAACNTALRVCVLIRDGGSEVTGLDATSSLDAGFDSGGVDGGGKLDGGVADSGMPDAALDAGETQQPICSVNNWCWRNPVPVGSWLQTVFGISPEDVWVGGPALFLHWDGSVWTQYDWAGADAMRGIWGSGSSDVWAVGTNGAIAHWDGTTWSSASSSTVSVLNSVIGVASSSVWAVGAAGTIVHWDGTKWAGEASPTAKELRSVWGTGPTALWAVGDTGTILRRTSGGWTAEASPVNSNFVGICGTSATDVWSVGADGAAIHNDGSGWALVSNAGVPLTAVACPSSGTIWATSSKGTIHSWNGQAWSTALANASGKPLFSLWMQGPDAGWAVGFVGALMRRTSAGWLAAGTDEFVGNGAVSVWAEFPDKVLIGGLGKVVECNRTVCNTLAQAADAGPLYISASHQSPIYLHDRVAGVVYALDGGVLLDTGIRAARAAVADASDGGSVLWYADYSGAVARCSGTCSTMDGGAAPLSMWAFENEAWLVGGFGSARRCTAQGCVATPTGTTYHLYAVWGRSPNEVWAVGASGAILRWNGSVWTSVPSPVIEDFQAVSGAGTSTGWIAGKFGSILTWNGTSWIKRSSGANWALSSIWSSSPTNAWAVGGPVFLEYRP